MSYKKLYIAVLLQALIVSGQSFADVELPGYTDPRFGRPKDTLYDLSSQRPEPEQMFWLKDSLFTPYIEPNDNEIDRLYAVNTYSKIGAPKKITALNDSLTGYVDVNTSSILTYLFKNYLKSGKNYQIPIVVSTEESRLTRGYDAYYKDESECRGLTHLEADLKNKCVIQNKNNFGLIEINYSKDLELYKNSLQLKQIPDNGINESYSYKLLSTFPSLIGFWSNHNEIGFKGPLSSLDKQLYSEKLKSNVKERSKFSEFGSTCYASSFNKCDLYFSGRNTQLLFGQKTENFEDIPFSKDLNLPIHFGLMHKPFVSLRNTVLSSSSFVNYGFYTQAEVALLKDLGYDINDKEFFGKSIYKSGTKDQYNVVHVKDGFYAWSDELHGYKNDQPSRLPVSIGTHVYGSYNDVTQDATIASIGYASVGVRVDGSYNNVTIAKNAAVIENGVNSSGIAVTYGRNNNIDVEGRVEAKSQDGIGIRLDFGSNALSDLNEYQGSYRRVRTHDYQSHLLTKAQAQAMNAPEEIRGPLVNTINITGSVSGKKAAIYIDQSAHVKQINLGQRARVVGDIISRWQAYLSEDNSGYYANHSNYALLPGRLQFDKDEMPRNSYERNKVLRNLKTNVNLGVKPITLTGTSKLIHYEADPKANIVVEGDIKGSSLLVSSFGGHTAIKGIFDVDRLYVANSVIHAYSAGHNNYFNELELNKNAQLDLVNGFADNIIVRNLATISGNSIISVDVDKNGNILDKLTIDGELNAHDILINLEPGMSYSEIKSYQSDPKALLDMMNAFVKNANQRLSRYGVTSKYPKHIWYVQGQLGRQVKCSSRGCYLGDFVNSFAKSQESLPLWRYILSILGCIGMLFGCLWFAKKSGTGRFG